MSRQFDEAARMWESGEGVSKLTGSLESMSIDLVEHDDKFVATVDLPGYERDDVEIKVSDHTLHVEAEREEAKEEEEAGRYLRRERRRESAQRSIQLPDEVMTEEVTAKMRNGVLTISLPKSELDEAREIEIE